MKNQSYRNRESDPDKEKVLKWYNSLSEEEKEELRKQFEQKKNEVLQSTENMGRQINGK